MDKRLLQRNEHYALIKPGPKVHTTERRILTVIVGFSCFKCMGQTWPSNRPGGGLAPCSSWRIWTAHHRYLFYRHEAAQSVLCVWYQKDSVNMIQGSFLLHSCYQPLLCTVVNSAKCLLYMIFCTDNTQKSESNNLFHREIKIIADFKSSFLIFRWHCHFEKECSELKLNNHSNQGFKWFYCSACIMLYHPTSRFWVEYE